MSNFKPPADSFAGKILKNATALFFLVMISLFAGTFFFYKSSKSKQDTLDNESRKSSLSRRHYLSEPGETIEVTGNVNTDPDTTDATVKTDQKSALAKDIKDQSAEEIRENLENQLFRKESTSKDLPTNVSNQYELRIYFAEVSAKGLDMLMQEARASGQSSNTDFAQGVVALPMTKILSYRDDFNVYSELSKHLEKNKASDWFQGLKSAGPDSDIGLSQTLQIKDSPNGRAQLEIKITKRYQANISEGSNKGFHTLDYIGSGEVDKDQTYFMAEILSKYPMSSQQEYLIAISPFEIYKSQNFLGGKTFSVFFYTIENK